MIDQVLLGISRFASRNARLGLAVMVGASLGLARTALAVNGADTWLGNTSAVWSGTGNWSPAANPTPISGDSLVFGAAGSSGLNLTDDLGDTPAAFNINGITFNSGAGAFVVAPGTPGTTGFTLTGSLVNNSTALETINDLIGLSATQTITTNTGNITLGGIISSTGAFGITKTGGGTLTLSGLNSYTGTTTISTTGDINAVVANNSSAFGSGSIFINGSDHFNGDITANTGLTINNAVTLKPTTDRAIILLNGTANWHGNVTVDGSLFAGQAIFVANTGTTSSAPCVLSGNVSHTGANANIFDLRGSGGFGNVTGSISYGTGDVQLLDTTNWQFSNASNTWGTLDIANNSATAYVGATNTLSPTGVVTASTTTGTLRLTNLAGTSSFSQAIAGLASTVNVSNPLTASPVTLTIAPSVAQANTGVISGALALSIGGSASQTLSGLNTYTGGTSITSGGVLLIGNASGSATGSGSIADTGGTLGGSGIIALGSTKIITIGTAAHLAPGTPGLLTITGSQTGTPTAGAATLNFASGGNFDAIINGTTAGSGYSKVALTGNVDLGGSTLNVTLGTTLASNEDFTVIGGPTGVLNTFNGFIEGSTVLVNNGFALDISYTGSANLPNNGGHDVVLYTVATPEPGCLGVLALGSVGFLARRRTKKILP